MAARWPLAVACLYAALIPLQPVLGFGDGSRLRFAAADAVAPLVLLAALMHPRRRMPFALAATVAAIPVVAALSTLISWSERPISTYAIGKTAGLFYLAATTLAMVRCLDRDAVPAVVRALGFGAYWSALVGLAGYGAYLAGIPTTLVEFDRLTSTMPEDPNIYGSLAAVGLLIAVTDRRLGPGRRLLRATVLGLALLLTGSRSALLGAVVGAGTLVAVRARDPLATGMRGAFGLVVALALAGVVLLGGLGGSSADRLRDFFWRGTTVSSRLALYEQAWQEFTESPVTGLGVGGFRERSLVMEDGSVQHYVVHNVYLWAFVDMGMAGGFLLIGLLVGTVWHCVRAARGRPPVDGAALVAAGLMVMIVFNLFIDGFYQRHFWVLVACAVMAPVYRGARRTVPGRPPVEVVHAAA